MCVVTLSAFTVILGMKELYEVETPVAETVLRVGKYLNYVWLYSPQTF